MRKRRKKQRKKLFIVLQRELTSVYPLVLVTFLTLHVRDNFWSNIGIIDNKTITAIKTLIKGATLIVTEIKIEHNISSSYSSITKLSRKIFVIGERHARRIRKMNSIDKYYMVKHIFYLLSGPNTKGGNLVKIFMDLSKVWITFQHLAKYS